MAKSQYDQPLFYRIGKVLFYILLAIAIVILSVVSFHTIYFNNKGVPPKVFGYTVMVSESNSLKATVNSGDALLIKEVPMSSLKEGDIITVKASYNKIGLPVLDTQVFEEFVKVDDKEGMKTRTNEGVVDAVRYESDLIGLVVAEDGTWGKVITFLKSPEGIIVCVAIPLLLLLVIQIINFIVLSAPGSKKNATTAVLSGMLIRPIFTAAPPPTTD